MTSCIFCEIVSKKAPAYIVYEDEHFIAFLDTFPKTWGHTVVISKSHYRWVWDVPQISDYFAVVNTIIQHYKKVLGIETCYQTVWGNEIHHAHVHILPAYRPLHKPMRLTEEEAEDVLEKLRMTSTTS